MKAKLFLRTSALSIALCAGLALGACDDKQKTAEESSSSVETTAESALPPAGGEETADKSPIAMAGPEPAPAVATEEAGSTSSGSEGGSAVTENELPPGEDVPPPPPREVFSMDGTAAEAACDFDAWVGQKVDMDTIEKTGRIYRILKPDSMMTMDHNPERVNVVHDDDMVVTKVWCG